MQQGGRTERGAIMHGKVLGRGWTCCVKCCALQSTNSGWHIKAQLASTLGAPQLPPHIIRLQVGACQGALSPV